MIDGSALRPGNIIMQKLNGRIVTLPCTAEHFRLIEQGGAKDIFPVLLKDKVLESCGFVENKDYPLQPQAREFKLVLPVPGTYVTEIVAYTKSNGECFGRLQVDGKAASLPLHHLHQVQNMYYSLTGEELAIRK